MVVRWGLAARQAVLLVATLILMALVLQHLLAEQKVAVADQQMLEILHLLVVLEEPDQMVARAAAERLVQLGSGERVARVMLAHLVVAAAVALMLEALQQALLHLRLTSVEQEEPAQQERLGV